MSNGKKLGVAIVGNGPARTLHRSAWSLAPRCEVKAIVSKNSGKKKKIKMGSNIAIYSDLGQALEENGNRIDIVDICTSPNTRSKLALLSMKKGKNVLVERPIALSLVDVDEMNNVALDQNVKLMGGYVMRFFPEYSKMKQIVADGAIGEPIISRVYKVRPMLNWGELSSKSKNNVGLLFDLALDDIDFLRWCYDDEVIGVFAKSQRSGSSASSADDFALINLRFSRGGIALIECRYTPYSSFHFSSKLEIDGTQGALSFDNQSNFGVKFYQNGSMTEYRADSPSLQYAAESPSLISFCREFAHFADCVMKNESPMISAKVARKSLEVVIAAVESSQKNVEVKPASEAS
jgi:UDP-N-acetylglucosamine 3-dehydrogenase